MPATIFLTPNTEPVSIAWHQEINLGVFAFQFSL